VRIFLCKIEMTTRKAQYDQLHRITKSRSLTSYTANNGFAARTASPPPYDEDYSYDANGNLLTLQRHDDQSNLLNDFNYLYYPGTNRLRQVEPPADKVYDGGAIVSNTELYRKITIQGNAYVPQGQPVELRALEEIEMDPDFEAPDGTDFWAHIVADSGMYQYDAIGNLILDQYDGVKITWTPYGKVHEVKTKSDSVTVSFRYDGAGNRIEKKVVKYDTTYVTNYVRDASGNVMTIYKNAIIAEQPIYGSSRVGMYRGGRYNGQRNLGEKNYELGNHLGNVLVVIADNIGTNSSDSIWANVNSTSDYYPFGFEMTGSNWRDTLSIYRYGFNGKERDGDEFGNTHYDYGFRIYNPIIGKFLSVDPLFSTYPWLGPYQFGENRPIVAIDIDGLEAQDQSQPVSSPNSVVIPFLSRRSFMPHEKLSELKNYFLNNKEESCIVCFNNSVKVALAKPHLDLKSATDIGKLK
jgi:RHS repeat-associated protein